MILIAHRLCTVYRADQIYTGNATALAPDLIIGYAEGYRTSWDAAIGVASGSVFDAPVYSWIQARQRRTQTYAFFLAEIPLGFKGVADLRTENGRIVIVERETGKTITVKSARLE